MTEPMKVDERPASAEEIRNAYDQGWSKAQEAHPAVYRQITTERLRAHRIHGPRSMEYMNWTPTSRLAILVEEVGEIARELIEHPLETQRLRTELIQVAAVSCAWIAAIDAGKALGQGRNLDD